MIATKQFENWPLYSGQETSTRYVDITGVGYLNPFSLEHQAVLGIKEAGVGFEKYILKLFDFYKKALPVLKEKVRVHFPKRKQKDGESEEKYAIYCEQHENTVHAKACDILGAYLPCGAKTNMSIAMNIRQLGEHFQQMCFLIHAVGNNFIKSSRKIDR